MGAPIKPWEPYCRVGHEELRHQKETIQQRPGTKVAAVLGLCGKHYNQIRKGEIEDPRTPYRPVQQGWQWRSDLTPEEQQVLESATRRLPIGSEELEQVGDALGFRTDNGLATYQMGGYLGGQGPDVRSI